MEFRSLGSKLQLEVDFDLNLNSVIWDQLGYRDVLEMLFKLIKVCFNNGVQTL